MTIRIEICGGIASGKTTLAKVLSDDPVLENFAGNQFLAAFYEEPLRWFEEKNFSFLIEHVAAIKNSDRGGAAPLVCDFSVLQDVAYAELSGDDAHASLMTRLYLHLYGRLPPPALVVHLECPVDVQLARITSRNRAMEADISAEYLQVLNDRIEATLAKLGGKAPVHRLDVMAVDLLGDPQGASRLKQELLARALRA